MEEKNNIDSVITFIVVLVLLVWLLMGCCPCKHLATSTRDSLRVDVVERIVEVRDTAYIDVPGDKQSVTTQDTTSFLENTYAMSRASIVGGGLYHDLVTKSHRLKIPFTVPTIQRDSIVYFNSHSTEIVEVEKSLTWWQETQIKGFWAMLAVLTIILLWKRIRRKISLL